MKIDVTNIKGYEDMTAEEKVAILEKYELEEDRTGWIRKDTFDKTASELAAMKKELKAKLSEEELAKQEREEELANLQTNYEKLLRKSNISDATSKFLALGYDDKLAAETAEAFVDGDTDKVFANQLKAQESFEKKIRADILKGTPRPQGGNNGQTITLESLRKMSPQERYKYSVEHPEEYKELYGGNE